MNSKVVSASFSALWCLNTHNLPGGRESWARLHFSPSQLFVSMVRENVVETRKHALFYIQSTAAWVLLVNRFSFVLAIFDIITQRCHRRERWWEFSTRWECSTTAVNGRESAERQFSDVIKLRNLIYFRGALCSRERWWLDGANSHRQVHEWENYM